MSYYATGQELQDELYAFLTDFLASAEGERAAETARSMAESATLVLRTVDPETELSVDFLRGRVVRSAIDEADVQVELEADALHDILLCRLDPVQLSRLFETDRLTFGGESRNLAALVMLAGALQPFYPASLARGGRQDLLDTPMPPTRVVWSVEGPPKEVIGKRRPWQRPKRTAEAV